MNQLEALLMMQATEEEAAAALDMGIDTLDLRVREMTGKSFQEYRKEKLAKGRMSMRRAQFVSATQNNNVAMQIWLGKNYLGQADKQQITGAGGEPLMPKLEMDYSKLSVEELRTMKVLRAKAATERVPEPEGSDAPHDG